MKYVLFIVLSVLASFISSGQDNPLDCSSFKTGKYVYKEAVYGSTVITRTDKKQTEKDTKTGIIIKSKLRWTGACEYELIQTWSNDKKRRKENGSVRKIAITQLFPDGYEYSCSCNDIKQTGTLLKIIN